MDYELREDCRFGRRGAVVSYAIWLGASLDERRRYFRERGAINSATESNYNAADSHGWRAEPLAWADGDATSSVSSSPPTEDAPMEYGGGRYGGGGASGDYGSSDDSNSSSSGSDYGSSDYGSSDSGSSDCGSSND